MTLSPDTLKPGASALPALCAGLSLFFALVGIPALAVPEPTARAWKAFPRNVWIGRLLAAAALAWSAAWLIAMPLGPLDFIRRYMAILLPVAILACWFLCDDLIACRALGGLFALYPSALLPAAQWHPSAIRFVPLVVGYLLAIAGMFLIAQPYHLRDLLFWGASSTGRTRLVGGVATALFAVMLVAAALA